MRVAVASHSLTVIRWPFISERENLIFLQAEEKKLIKYFAILAEE